MLYVASYMCLLLLGLGISLGDSISEKGPEHRKKPSSCENRRECVWKMSGQFGRRCSDRVWCLYVLQDQR